MEHADKAPDGPQHRESAAKRAPGPLATPALVDNSAQGISLRALTQMMNHSPPVKVQQALNARMSGSPYMVAQRKQLESLSGDAAQRSAAPEEELLQAKFETVQRAEPEEEELLQGKFGTVQRAEPEEEELLQGKFETVQRAEPEEEELLQGKFAPVQRAEPEEQELLQGKFAPVQRAEPDRARRANDTGLPDNLKTGIEALSGVSLDQVKVHDNSAQPAQLNALAYAQGSDIHLAPGQERHLPHEAWHVVQQAQGRVQPTMQMKDGVAVNDDAGLEHEADVMGAKALNQSLQQRSLEGAVTIKRMNDLVQRSVTEFGVDSVDYDPPGTDILETIDDADFTQTRKQISNNVRTFLNDPLVKTLSVPERVTATLEQSAKGAAHPDRQGSRSRNIGLIGRDEFWLKTGLVENFEGGHIIPHSLWDNDDNDVEFAGSYENLVPMSRTLNVIDWCGKEDAIKEKLASIAVGDQLEVAIDIGHQSYSRTNQQIAKRFDLNIAPGRDPNKQNMLNGWSLANASVSWTHVETGSDMELSDVEENNLRNTHAEIEDVGELIKNLKSSGFWIRMSESLKNELEALL